ncbi:TPR Domain containing protein [Planoprotostelium fungivorum]|uniref:TPR Domain containing protein n=1 Tax=Planoprotostelium fungivorum TaxID=1890364 RepID=A0A2P6NEM8_9EUKA|nr:TPR Domain containing protein [Planoprotostelium fungivorum]
MSSKKDYKKAESYYFKGLANNDQGNWGTAEEEFLRALVLFSKLNSWEKGNLTETLKHWLSALSIYEDRLRQKTEAGELCLDIGDLHYEMKNMYGAGQYYSRAHSLFMEEPLDNDLNMGLVNHKLGNVCFNQERFPQAERHFLLAQPIYEKFSREEGLADIFKAMGHIYMVQEDYVVGQKYFRKAFEIFSKIERTEQQTEVSNLLLSIENRLEQKRLEKKQRDLEKKLKDLEGQGRLSEASLTYSASENDLSDLEVDYHVSALHLGSKPSAPSLHPGNQQRPNPTSKVEVLITPTQTPRPPPSRNQLQQIFSNITNQQSVESIVKKQKEPDVVLKQVAPLKKITPKNPRRRL